MELEETRLLVPHLICICQFFTKKSQDKVSLGPYSGDAIEMSLSTRAFQRWYDCGNLFFFDRFWIFSLPAGRSYCLVGTVSRVTIF